VDLVDIPPAAALGHWLSLSNKSIVVAFGIGSWRRSMSAHCGQLVLAGRASAAVQPCEVRSATH
jgi:hypothetical protein